VLSFLQDLIAYSLQVMRANVTFDQLPVLVRNGLVQLAIDGFDELGDLRAIASETMPELPNRVRVWRGDLALPDLDLTNAKRDEIQERHCAIYHNAAQVIDR
jgi:thioester reductase-like protein